MTDYTQIIELFGLNSPKGCAENEIGGALAVFDHLPAALVDYYRQLGGECELNQTQDSLVLPGELYLIGDYLCFYQENQCVAQWCISLSDLARDNPPVCVTYNEKDFFTESHTVTDFLTTMAYLQGVFAFAYVLEEMVDIEEPQAAVIRSSFTKIPQTLTNWIGIEFYANHTDSVVALMKASNEEPARGYFVLYASRSPEHFKEIDAFFCLHVFADSDTAR